MKKIYALLALILYIMTAQAQKSTDANITGHVINKKTREHIPFINIEIEKIALITATDASGHYRIINLQPGEYIIKATGIGFKEEMKKITVEAHKTIEINFELQETSIIMNEVVVSANRNETNRRESASIINILNQKIFDNTNAVSLAQGLNFQPGLRVENNCQNCGFQQVRVNGLEGPYSQILIDSRPVFSSLAGVYGIEQIPVNMIERVEILRGGGSALFGSNAIAGTINIITKEPRVNTATISNTTSLMYGRAADVNTTVNASIVTDNYKTGLMIFGSARQRSPLDYDRDGFTEISKINTKNIGFRGFLKPGAYDKLTLEYHNLSEFRRGGSQLNLPPHESEIAEQIEHNNNLASIKYDIASEDKSRKFNIFSSFQHIGRKSYYGAQKDPNAYGFTLNKTLTGGMQYTQAVEKLFFMPAEITTGIEYTSDIIKDTMLGYNRIIHQSTNIKSIFLQNEWKNKKLSVLAGARLDKHNFIHNTIVSPRINIRYAPYETINYRVSYSNGFRAPQAFDEDLHITAVGGNVSLIQMDPNLKTEHSTSYSASADMYKLAGNVQINLLIEGFYTDLRNVFVLEQIGKDKNGNILLERRNGAGAIVKGFNIEGTIVPIFPLQCQFGFTIQKSEYKQPHKWSDNPAVLPQKRMFRSPDYYGYMNVLYQKHKWNISLFGNYTGPMLVQHFKGYIAEDTERLTRNFFDTGLKISYNFKTLQSTLLQINIGMHNIFNSYQQDFDKGGHRDAGYNYGPSLPRTVFAGMKVTI